MRGRKVDEDYLAKLYERFLNGEMRRSLAIEANLSESTLGVAFARLKAKGFQTTNTGGASVAGVTPLASAPYITPSHNRSIVLAIPDMHHPFVHPDALEFLKSVRSKYQCNKFVCLGDECDFAAFSRYIPDPDGMSPGKELAAAIESLTPFYIAFPEMMVCESNHTVRPMKKMFEAGLPAAFLPTYAKMLNAPDGWVWKHQWIIDGVRYHHGDAGKSGQFAPAAYMKAFKQSNVHGHLHGNACVMYEGGHFGVNAGCLINPTAYAFKYAKNVPVPVSLGCAVIIDGKEAHFVPLHTDESGRWTGLL